MKFLVLALCVCMAAGASPVYRAFDKAARAQPFSQVAQAAVSRVSSGAEATAQILRADSDVQPDGYNFAYETGNGIAAQASGSLKKVDKDDVLVSQGSFQYVAPDGTPIKVDYVADENGYQPQSNILPVGPPIPEAIARSIAYNAAHAAAEPSRKSFF